MARFSSAGVLTRRATQGGEDQGKGFIDPSSALSEFCFQKVVSMKTLSTLLVLTVTFSPRRFAAPSPPVNDDGRSRKASRDPGNDELRRLDGDRNGFQRQRHGAVCRCAGARCRAPLLSRGAIANSALNRNDAVGADEATACSFQAATRGREFNCITPSRSMFPPAALDRGSLNEPPVPHRLMSQHRRSPSNARGLS